MLIQSLYNTCTMAHLNHVYGGDLDGNWRQKIKNTQGFNSKYKKYIYATNWGFFDRLRYLPWNAKHIYSYIGYGDKKVYVYILDIRSLGKRFEDWLSWLVD